MKKLLPLIWAVGLGVLTSLPAFAQSYPHPTLNYTQSAGGDGVARTYQSKFDDYVSVLDYGCLNNNTGNQSACITTALNAATAVGKALYFPGGTYAYGSTVVPPTGAVILCDGYQSTIFNVTTTASTEFLLTNPYVTIKDCQFASASTQVAGSSYITVNGSNDKLIDLYVNNAFTAITVDSSSTGANDIHNLYIERFTSGSAVPVSGVDMVVNSCTNCMMINSTMANALATASKPFAHMVFNNNGDFHMYDVNLIGALHDMYIDPGNGQSVSEIKFIGGYLDQAEDMSVAIAPTGTGNVNKISFVDTWFYCAQTSCINFSINSSGTSVVELVECSMCEMYAATSSSTIGVAISQGSGTTMGGIQVFGGVIAGQGTGFFVSTVASFQLADVAFGGGLLGSPNTAISLNGTIGLASIHDVHNSGSAVPLANSATITTSNIHNNF